MSQYSRHLQQEMDSSENTLYCVLEPLFPDYSGNNPSTVVAKVLYTSTTTVSLRNMPCAFLMFLSYPARPQLVSHWTLFLTTTQSLTCSYRPQMESWTSYKKKNFSEKKVDSVTLQYQSMEEEADPVRIAQQELEQG